MFIFGAKSAPGYKRAKAIIKFINEIADKINSDVQTNNLLKVVFVHNYNVVFVQPFYLRIHEKIIGDFYAFALFNIIEKLFFLLRFDCGEVREQTSRCRFPLLGSKPAARAI